MPETGLRYIAHLSPTLKKRVAAGLKKPKKKGVVKTVHCAKCGQGVEYETKHGRATSAKKGCGRCRAVFYCSQACMDAHWPEHKPHCTKADDPKAQRRRKNDDAEGI